MRKWIVMLLTGFFITASAQAATCEEQAVEKKLHGAAKTSFIKKCEKDAGKNTCEAQATEKKLHGAAKTSFLKKCNADKKPLASAQDACELQAKDRKLYGAAKNSFVKKCVETAAK